MTGPVEVLSAALSYAKKGWPVLPVRFSGKAPAVATGFHAAATDEATIQGWFGQAPRNVGIRTGRQSGLVVLDVDPRNGGDGSLARLIEEHGPLPETLTASTGSGGWHFYFQMPAGADVPCRSDLAGYAGLDVKSEGGYVVAAPSIHPDGDAYSWTSAYGVDAPLADIPPFLLELTRRGKGGTASKTGAGMISGREDIPQGSRNNTLFQEARRLRDLGLGEDQVLTLVLQQNQKCSTPLDEREVSASVKSAMSRAAPITDMVNARRLVTRAGGDYRYDPIQKRWYQWTGRVWREDVDGAVMRLAKSVAEDVMAEALAVDDPDLQKKAVRAARAMQAQARLKAMIELAQTEPEIPVFLERMDAHPLLLNVQNGVVDLRTGQLCSHDRELLLTKILPFEYNPAAECPTFRGFLDQAFCGRSDLIDFVQRAIGYAATGDTREQVFFVLNGAGANGKSTLLNVLSHVLDQHASHTPSETLITHRHGRGSSNDIARLVGKRFVTASEFNPGERLAAGLIKQITGNEAVTARFLFREHFEFRPSFKLFLATNHIPEMDAADDAIWRRFLVIPFDRSFTKEQQDPTLAARLIAEAEGILAWIAEGAKQWWGGGLETPTSVSEIAESVRRDMDPIAQFVEETCVLGSALNVPSAELHTAFLQWSARHGIAQVDTRSFGKRLAKKGYHSRKSNGRMILKGLQLRPEFSLQLIMGRAA